MNEPFPKDEAQSPLHARRWIGKVGTKNVDGSIGSFQPLATWTVHTAHTYREKVCMDVHTYMVMGEQGGEGTSGRMVSVLAGSHGGGLGRGGI